MARSNWTWWTNGSWTTTTDYYLSSERSFKCVAGEGRFLYNGGNILNTRVYAYCMHRNETGQMGYTTPGTVLLRCSQLNPLVDGYRIRLFAYQPSNYAWYLLIERYKTGVSTALTTYCGLVVGSGFAKDTWHRFRFSCTNEGADVRLTAEWYNGSSWQLWYSYLDTHANKITAAGMAGFGWISSYANDIFYFDDVQVVELT